MERDALVEREGGCLPLSQLRQGGAQDEADLGITDEQILEWETFLTGSDHTEARDRFQVEQFERDRAAEESEWEAAWRGILVHDYGRAGWQRQRKLQQPQDPWIAVHQNFGRRVVLDFSHLGSPSPPAIWVPRTTDGGGPVPLAANDVAPGLSDAWWVALAQQVDPRALFFDQLRRSWAHEVAATRFRRWNSEWGDELCRLQGSLQSWMCVDSILALSTVNKATVEEWYITRRTLALYQDQVDEDEYFAALMPESETDPCCLPRRYRGDIYEAEKLVDFEREQELLDYRSCSLSWDLDSDGHVIYPDSERGS
jgi:hypothetical protein